MRHDEREGCDDLTGLAVWYGDRDLAVLVDWRTGCVVGVLRYDGEKAWTADIRLSRWNAFQSNAGRRLRKLGGGLTHAWYALPSRTNRKHGQRHIEAFFPDFAITGEDLQ